MTGQAGARESGPPAVPCDFIAESGKREPDQPALRWKIGRVMESACASAEARRILIDDARRLLDPVS